MALWNRYTHEIGGQDQLALEGLPALPLDIAPEALRIKMGQHKPLCPRTGGDLARPLLREILREVDLTPDELLDQLKNL
jgi:hypothetical protein